jgi:serine/threonine protein kinase
MSEPIGERLKRDGLALKLDLGEILFSDAKHGVFRADYPEAGGNMREVQVQLFLEDGRRPGERLNRFLEAKYLDDPHLLRYIEAGTLVRDEGPLIYVVTEQPDEWASRSLAAEQAVAFADDLIAGLEYLHRRDLVYCVLSPDTVVPVGSSWKLSDFSQLRVAGTEISDEVLGLASALDTCAPEAADGLVSPAWDVWSFGKTLRKVLTGSRADVPDPFRAVCLACLNINPSSRPTLDQIAELLEPARAANREGGISTAAWA